MPAKRTKQREEKDRYVVVLSRSCDEALTRVARESGCSRSRAIENAFVNRYNYVELYKMFMAKVPFAEVVINTGYDPDIIRSIYETYMKGYPVLTEEERKELVDKQVEIALKRIRSRDKQTEARERIEMEKLRTREFIVIRKTQLSEKQLRIAQDEQERRDRTERMERLMSTTTKTTASGGIP